MMTPWNCLAVAFSNASGIPIETINKEVGHDGGQVLWPDNKLPFDRCAFHTQEMIDVCLRHNLAVVMIEANPVRANQFDFKQFPVQFSVTPEKRLSRYLDTYNGVLKGLLRANGHAHAVAWDSEKQIIIDPSRKVTNMNDLEIGWFFIVQPLKSN